MKGSSPKRRLSPIRSVDQIPRFKSEREEAEFWATHSVDAIWDQLDPVEFEVSGKARRIDMRGARKRPVTLRLEERQVRRAKELARVKSLSYQALLRAWISEGIAREGHRHA